MIPILTGSLLISLLHAVIPNHWLPVLAISRKEKWTLSETMSITFIAGFAHVLSTVIIGVLLGILGAELQGTVEQFTKIVAPIILVLLGFYFIRQHYQHHHFHLQKQHIEGRPKSKIIVALALAMFLSPCMEIEAYFLLAGAQSWWFLFTLALLYATISLGGMLLWVRIAYKGMVRLNWHALEHNAGIITGIVLILTGLISFFIS
jgi:nickel/cobalt transporter (NicO) family protein